MHTSLSLAVLALAASTTGAARDWKDLVGEPVPAFEAKGWIHAKPEEATVDALRGKVYLLEFFATW